MVHWINIHPPCFAGHSSSQARLSGIRLWTEPLAGVVFSPQSLERGSPPLHIIPHLWLVEGLSCMISTVKYVVTNDLILGKYSYFTIAGDVFFLFQTSGIIYCKKIKTLNIQEIVFIPSISDSFARSVLLSTQMLSSLEFPKWWVLLFVLQLFHQHFSCLVLEYHVCHFKLL